MGDRQDKTDYSMSSGSSLRRLRHKNDHYYISAMLLGHELVAAADNHQVMTRQAQGTAAASANDDLIEG